MACIYWVTKMSATMFQIEKQVTEHCLVYIYVSHKALQIRRERSDKNRTKLSGKRTASGGGVLWTLSPRHPRALSLSLPHPHWGDWGGLSWPRVQGASRSWELTSHATAWSSAPCPRGDSSEAPSTSSSTVQNIKQATYVILHVLGATLKWILIYFIFDM